MLRREVAQSEPMSLLLVGGAPVSESGVAVRRGEAAQSEPMSLLLVGGAPVSESGAAVLRGEAASEPMSLLLVDRAPVNESGVPISGDCVSACLSDRRVSRAAAKSDDSAGSDNAREPARRALLPLPAESAKVRRESSTSDVTDSSSLGSGSRKARLGR